jgi:hypothetical protein
MRPVIIAKPKNSDSFKPTMNPIRSISCRNIVARTENDIQNNDIVWHGSKNYDKLKVVYVYGWAFMIFKPMII